MAQQKIFSQSDLIKAAGNQEPQGICMGLVVQWLISISKTVSDENRFWSDLQGSLAKAENVPLLGLGYARQAIEFQKEYGKIPLENLSAGEYALGQMKAAGLTFDNAIHDAESAFEDAPADKIVTRVLTNDTRYFILTIEGTLGAHAIGVYRNYSLVGKSSTVHIFDPNIGKFTCEDHEEIFADLDTIDDFYDGELNNSYVLEGFK